VEDQIRIRLNVDPNGEPTMEMLDAGGAVAWSAP
jgi:hypothetical protein